MRFLSSAGISKCTTGFIFIFELSRTYYELAMTADPLAIARYEERVCLLTPAPQPTRPLPISGGLGPSASNRQFSETASRNRRLGAGSRTVATGVDHRANSKLVKRGISCRNCVHEYSRLVSECSNDAMRYS